jgi:hypothetical protein
MDTLKGKWEFSKEPFSRGKVQNLHLTSDAGGTVAGSGLRECVRRQTRTDTNAVVTDFLIMPDAKG